MGNERIIIALSLAFPADSIYALIAGVSAQATYSVDLEKYRLSDWRFRASEHCRLSGWVRN